MKIKKRGGGFLEVGIKAHKETRKLQEEVMASLDEVTVFHYQEWNAEGNCTSYCGSVDTFEELEEIIENYTPHFEGCHLRWWEETEYL